MPAEPQLMALPGEGIGEDGQGFGGVPGRGANGHVLSVETVVRQQGDDGEQGQQGGRGACDGQIRPLGVIQGLQPRPP